MWSYKKLKELMQYFKPTLLNLFNSKNGMIAKKILLESSDRFLNLLLYVLFNIATGKIALDKALYPGLFHSKRASLLFKKLASKRKLKKFLSSSRREQLKFLAQFSSQFPALLKKLFYDESNPKHNNPSINSVEDGQTADSDITDDENLPDRHHNRKIKN